MIVIYSLESFVKVTVYNFSQCHHSIVKVKIYKCFSTYIFAPQLLQFQKCNHFKLLTFTKVVQVIENNF